MNATHIITAALLAALLFTGQAAQRVRRSRTENVTDHTEEAL